VILKVEIKRCPSNNTVVSTLMSRIIHESVRNLIIRGWPVQEERSKKNLERRCVQAHCNSYILPPDVNCNSQSVLRNSEMEEEEEEEERILVISRRESRLYAENPNLGREASRLRVKD
jgi:hypothetical protein